MPKPLSLTPSAARRFACRALGLESAHATLPAALAHQGYVQIDPINVCGRMHDLILRNRVAGYREGDLMRFLHGEPGRVLAAEDRAAFEHHVPRSNILVAFPLEAWPHLQGAMRARARAAGQWAGRLTPRERVLAAHLLAEIAARGPLGSEDFDDDRQARRVWGAAKLVKATLQKLFFHGRLLIAQRSGNRRRYDLPERVLPRSVLAQPDAALESTARWLALLKLRQWRLATLKRDELPLVSDLVQPLAVAGCPPLHCLQSDLPLLESAIRDDAGTPGPPRLLAPLDPLIYDRELTRALWDFDYIWEAYTPPARRVRGYYALPVLAGTAIVGHIEPRADRERRELVVVSRRIRRGHATAAALKELSRWLGLRSPRNGRPPAVRPSSTASA